MTVISPTIAPRRVGRYWELLAQLVRRDVATQYRGSLLGVSWSLLTPLLMLTVYTFVFSEIFGARWQDSPVGSASRLGFALNVFCGLIVFNLLATVLTRAPALIVGYPNYVKKVVFPLALLPLMIVGSALVQAMVAYGVLVVALLLTGELAPTALAAPLMALPPVLIAIALGWLLAALGVFLRDLGQVMVVVTQALLFLSPVFYPLSAVPELARPWFGINPLAWSIEALRGVTLYGRLPAWEEWALWTLTGLLAALMAYKAFQYLRSAFADVV